MGGRAGLGRAAPKEQPMQGAQGCKYRVRTVGKEWGSFPNSSEGEKGVLKFSDQGMVGNGRRWVHQSSSGWFCSWIQPSMGSVLSELLCSQHGVQ